MFLQSEWQTEVVRVCTRKKFGKKLFAEETLIFFYLFIFLSVEWLTLLCLHVCKIKPKNKNNTQIHFEKG